MVEGERDKYDNDEHVVAISSRDLLKQIARFGEQEVAKREEDYSS